MLRYRDILHVYLCRGLCRAQCVTRTDASAGMRNSCGFVVRPTRGLPLIQKLAAHSNAHLCAAITDNTGDDLNLLTWTDHIFPTQPASCKMLAMQQLENRAGCRLMSKSASVLPMLTVHRKQCANQTSAPVGTVSAKIMTSVVCQSSKGFGTPIKQQTAHVSGTEGEAPREACLCLSGRSYKVCFLD